MTAIAQQSYTDGEWETIGVLRIKKDGGIKVDSSVARIIEEPFFNADQQRLVDLSEPELFLETLVKFAGNAYYRWVEVDDKPAKPTKKRSRGATPRPNPRAT